MDRTVLTANEGMILTNGEIYAKRIELGDWDNAENYREITEEEYNALMTEEGGENLV
jgi:hypothetical protein